MMDLLGNQQIAENLKFAPIIYVWSRREAPRHCKLTLVISKTAKMTVLNPCMA